MARNKKKPVATVSAPSERANKPAAAAAPSSTTTSAISSVVSSRSTSPHARTKRKAFRFFDLPSELRLRIYEELLFVREPLDLGTVSPVLPLPTRENMLTPCTDPNNYYHIAPRLALFLASRRLHDESHRVFYAQPLRLFPFHGRFFHTKKPLLSRLPPRYRACLHALELRLGPGWSDPPKCQNTRSPTLGLEDCVNLRVLKIFVECDPSEEVFQGFRGKNATEETYKWFCVELLQGLFERVPSLELSLIHI